MPPAPPLSKKTRGALHTNSFSRPPPSMPANRSTPLAHPKTPPSSSPGSPAPGYSPASCAPLISPAFPRSPPAPFSRDPRTSPGNNQQTPEYLLCALAMAATASALHSDENKARGENARLLSTSRAPPMSRTAREFYRRHFPVHHPATAPATFAARPNPIAQFHPKTAIPLEFPRFRSANIQALVLATGRHPSRN